jgi:hypothetical protein
LTRGRFTSLPARLGLSSPNNWQPDDDRVNSSAIVLPTKPQTPVISIFMILMRHRHGG